MMNDDPHVVEQSGAAEKAELALSASADERPISGRDRRTEADDPFVDALDQRTVRRRLDAAERRIERLQHELTQLTDWRERSRRGTRQHLLGGVLSAVPAWIALAVAAAAAAIIWQDHRQLADLALQIPVAPAPADVASQPPPATEPSPGATQEPGKQAIAQPGARQGLPTLRHPASTSPPTSPRG
jgi:hypothetical protein